MSYYAHIWRKVLVILIVVLAGFVVQPAIAGVSYIHTDHLGTPQVMTDPAGSIVWEAHYSPFGEATITTNTAELNVRFPGQYFDEETELHYNYYRDYDPATGRYLQSDPIGLAGGLNTYGYVEGNPLRYVDPFGLYVPFWHGVFTSMGAASAGLSPKESIALANLVKEVDRLPHSQDPENAHMHAMCAPGLSRAQCQERFLDYIEEHLNACTQEGLAKAIHAHQDFYAKGHRNFRSYGGLLSLPPNHLYGDSFISEGEIKGVPLVTQNMIERFREKCSCEK